MTTATHNRPQDRQSAYFRLRSGLEVAHGVAGKRKTDDGNGRTDDHGGHQLIDPFHAGKLDDNGDDHIHKTCENSADDKTEVADRHGSGARKGGCHGAEECKGRAEEHGAFELGKGQGVHERTHACARTMRRRGPLPSVPVRFAEPLVMTGTTRVAAIMASSC